MPPLYHSRTNVRERKQIWLKKRVHTNVVLAASLVYPRISKSIIVISASLIIAALALRHSVTAVENQVQTVVQEAIVELDWSDNDGVRTLDLTNLDNYKFDEPGSCSLPNIRCVDNLKISLLLEKEWKITKVEPLDSAYLTPEDFATYYPDISVGQVHPGSPPDQIMLLQRPLYDRGILPVLPTGRFGAMTEQAILHFQQIKGIDPCTDRPAYADNRTVAEINKMKHRMRDPDYLRQTQAPNFEIQALCPQTKYRAQLLDDFIKAANRGKIRTVPKPIAPSRKEVQISLPSQQPGTVNEALKLEGFVRIEKE